MKQTNVRWMPFLSATLIGYSTFWFYFLILTIVATVSAIAVPVAQFSAQYGIPAAAYIGLVLVLSIVAATFTARLAFSWIVGRGPKANIWIVSVAVLISLLLTVQAFI